MSAPAGLRPAHEGELAMAWRLASRTMYFADMDEFSGFWRDGPWRVLLSEREELAIVVRWRAHLDLLAMLGLWCTPGRVPALVGGISLIAREHGFRGLLSPLLPENSCGPYLKSGMHVRERIAVLELGRDRARVDAPALAGVTVRPGTADDIPRILQADRLSFDEFWRSDEQDMSRLVGRMRCAVAEAGPDLIGYTLATVHATGGTLGRLCVIPDRRRSGVGRMLLSESIEYLRDNGAQQVVLSTQEENVAALSLYRSAGFRRMPGTSLLLSSDVAVDGPGHSEVSVWPAEGGRP